MTWNATAEQGQRTAQIRFAESTPVMELPPLDQTKQDLVDSAWTPRAVSVVGAPGTGKTTLALAFARARIAASSAGGDDVLVLSPTRLSAARMRERLDLLTRRTASRPAVRTPSGLAFAIECAFADATGQGRPQLVSGPEQDALLAELLAGHEQGLGTDPGWPARCGPQVRSMRGFRHELRDVLLRAADCALTPEDLILLGEKHGREEWVAAGRVYREYRQVLALERSVHGAPARVDTGSIVVRAAAHLHEWSRVAPDAAKPRWRTIVVDDYHEANMAFARLLRVLAADGAQVVVLGDPDSSVQGFRGAIPALLAEAEHPIGHGGGLGARRVVLERVFRQPVLLRAATRRVSDRIRVAGVASQRKALSAASAAQGSEIGELEGTVLTKVFRTRSQEMNAVATHVRRHHVLNAVPWSEIAVIVRAGADVEEVASALTSAGVPSDAAVARRPLRDEPAVRSILDALRCAIDPQALTTEVAVGLLTSPFGGLDSIELRRLRRALRVEEREHGGARGPDELVVEALSNPDSLTMMASPEATAARRIALMLANAHREYRRAGASVETVLWELWRSAGVESRWRELSLHGGAVGQRFDRELDSVIALFTAAGRFMERTPSAHPAAFIAEILAEDLPSDTLAARASDPERVTVTTASSAAGREWCVAVVAGVQDGTWPNLRIRDSVLGAHALADIVSGRIADPHGVTTDARRSVMDDELRFFAVAISRARAHLLVTAVEDEEQSPSVFLDFLTETDEAAAGSDSGASILESDPYSLRGLVAQLRRHVESAGPRAHLSAQLLAYLAANAVPGADPAEWAGLAPTSSDQPVWLDDQPVTVSPSHVETFSHCGLRWMLVSSGGEDSGRAGAAALGTLIHDIAARLPEGSREELLAQFEREWPSLGLGDGWVGQRQHDLASTMIDRLARYIAERRAAKARVVATEQRLDVLIGRARLHGQVDRLELDESGEKLRVIDLKTGTTRISATEAERNPQLGMYQVALSQSPSAEQVDGADLVYVGPGTVSFGRRTQPALSDDEDPQWAHRLLHDVADQMAQAEFVARVGVMCRTCPVIASCPAQNRGRQVTQ